MIASLGWFDVQTYALHTAVYPVHAQMGADAAIDALLLSAIGESAYGTVQGQSCTN
jgi:hypothetical protein